MMGRQVEQGLLFYEFRLEDRVPADHLLRKINALLDLGFVRNVMAKHYSMIGRPSVDPVPMVRMLLVGHLFGVRSERRLCEEVELNLAYRWFCRLGLDGRVPDHSTFTKNRHGRFRGSKLMRIVFERVVEQCLSLGIAEVRHVAVDGTHVSASASAERFVRSADEPPREGASRAVRDYLTDLDKAASDLPGTTRQKPAAISRTDPSSALSTKYGKRRFAYGLNAIIDTGSGVVLDVEAAPARTVDEPEAARRMVERTKERHGAKPSVLTADAAYGSGHFLSWAEGSGIEPHTSLPGSRMGSGKLFAKNAFLYDEAHDRYVCPAGKFIERSRFKKGTGPERWSGGLAMSYSASKRDCVRCPLKAKCYPNLPVKRLQRSIFEPAKDRARARIGTPTFRRSQRLRLRVERLFACIKHNDGLHCVRLRRRRGADEQFALAATARSLKLMAKLLSGPTGATVRA